MGVSARNRSPRARAVCSALREARQASGIGLRELGRMLGISDTSLSLWENGHRVPNTEQVAMILTAVRASPEERDRILSLARNANEPNWLAAGMDGVPQQLAGAVECERAAISITEWSLMGIPGLLQTSDYTRAIVASAGTPDNDIPLRVMIRSGRREVITRVESPVQFEALIGEATLYEPVGSSRIVADQLRHLHSESMRANVSVRIVPLGAGWHPGWIGPFVLYRFADSSPVAYLEHYSSGAFVSTEQDIADYDEAISKLRGIAKSPEESMEFILDAAQKMEEDP